MTVHEQLVNQWETYLAENARFEEKGIKVARTRAKKALLEISKLCKERRKELKGTEESTEE